MFLVKENYENFKKFINLVEKYKQNVQIKKIYNYNEYSPIENLGEFISNFGWNGKYMNKIIIQKIYIRKNF